jgi:hypothetical protein
MISAATPVTIEISAVGVRSIAMRVPVSVGGLDVIFRSKAPSLKPGQTAYAIQDRTSIRSAEAIWPNFFARERRAWLTVIHRMGKPAADGHPAMIADHARPPALPARTEAIPSFELLLRRFDRGGLPRPALIWNPTPGDLPSAELRTVRSRWSDVPGDRHIDAPVDILFIDPAFRLLGYPRRGGSQIVAIGDGRDGTGALDVVDLPMEVDLLRAVYTVAHAFGRSVLISLSRPTMLSPAPIDRLVLPVGPRGLLLALAPRR